MTDPDALARRARLEAAGFETQDPVNLRRVIPLEGGGEGMAAFTVCRTPADSMAEGRVQILTQLTEDLVWQPRWMTHENGIVARSEEHTSELQSLMRISYAVFCLKIKKNKYTQY